MQDRALHPREAERQAGQDRGLEADDMHEVGALCFQDAGEVPGLRRVVHRVAPARPAVEIDHADARRRQALHMRPRARDDHDLARQLREHADDDARAQGLAAVSAEQQHGLAGEPGARNRAWARRQQIGHVCPDNVAHRLVHFSRRLRTSLVTMPAAQKGAPTCIHSRASVRRARQLCAIGRWEKDGPPRAFKKKPLECV